MHQAFPTCCGAARLAALLDAEPGWAGAWRSQISGL
jgi:hypothetical protein